VARAFDVRVEAVDEVVHDELQLLARRGRDPDLVALLTGHDGPVRSA
jgi:hypothetical protein